MAEANLYPLEAMLLATRERHPFKVNLMPEKEKEMGWYRKRHPLFERICCGGNAT